MSTKPKTVLIVDDDEPTRAQARRDAQARLPRAAARERRGRARDARPARRRRSCSSTSRLPGISGLEVLRIVRENYPLTEVIMISAESDVETAVQAMKLGAYHYVTKDVDDEALLSVVAQRRRAPGPEPPGADAQRAGRRERTASSSSGRAARCARWSSSRSKIAKLSATVLILGESGTGKELLARLIHREGERPTAPFITVNLAAIPRELVESTLFGHEKGAFTGAHPAAARQVRAGVGRHAVPRRDWRPAARPAGQAAARDPGGRDRARRRDQADPDRLPADRRDQRRPRAGGEGRPLPRGPLLPPQRHPDPDAAAARAARGHPGARRTSSCGATRRGSASRSTASPTRRWRSCRSYWWPGNIRELENLIERLVAITDKEWITDEDLPFEYQVDAARARGAATGEPAAARDRHLRAQLHPEGAREIRLERDRARRATWASR